MIARIPKKFKQNKKSQIVKKPLNAKKPVKYREVPKLNHSFDADHLQIVLERKGMMHWHFFFLDRASLAWNYFGRLFNKMDNRYIDKINVYCTLCLHDLVTRQKSKELELPTARFVFFNESISRMTSLVSVYNTRSSSNKNSF